MPISVCIATADRPDQIENLLRNLLSQEKPPFEIIITDGSHTEETQNIVSDFLRRSPWPIKYYRSDKCQLTYQRNIAIDKSMGEILCFLDDDVLLAPDFLKIICEHFTNDTRKEIGGIGGYIENAYDKRPSPMWKIKEKLGLAGTLTPGEILPYGEFVPLSYLKPFTGLKQVHYECGCCCWRKEVFNIVRPPLDFLFYGVGEDKYFSCIIGRRYKLYVCGDAKLHHVKHPSNRLSVFFLKFFEVYNRSLIFRGCGFDKNVVNYFKFYLFYLLDSAAYVFSFLPWRRKWTLIKAVFTALYFFTFNLKPKWDRKTVYGQT